MEFKFRMVIRSLRELERGPIIEPWSMPTFRLQEGTNQEITVEASELGRKLQEVCVDIKQTTCIKERAINCIKCNKMKMESRPLLWQYRICHL